MKLPAELLEIHDVPDAAVPLLEKGLDVSHTHDLPAARDYFAECIDGLEGATAPDLVETREILATIVEVIDEEKGDPNVFKS